MENDYVIRQPTSQEDIAALLKAHSNPKANNRPILASNMHKMQLAKNNGFPKDMYHASLAPVMIFNEDQERAIAEKGYVPYYIPHTHPRTLYRRNMHPKFFKSQTELKRIQTLTAEAQKIEMTTVNPDDYIEERIVASAEIEANVRKEKVTANQSAWFDTPTKIEPFPDAPSEPPGETIARLQGELNALKGKSKAA